MTNESLLTVSLGERSYPIYIGENKLTSTETLVNHIKTDKVIIVTNNVVEALLLNTLKNTLSEFDIETIVIPDGEQYKTLDSYHTIMTRLLELRASRDTTLIALGGGVIGDITGFVAATFQRGMPFIQVPTTLLSQVDSSVGGKTAVNHPLGKNMIGAFYQPKAVVIDIQSLNTLPTKEFAAGMAEVIKYGVIYDAEFFTWLENNIQGLLNKEPEVLIYAIERCCAIKADIVSQDEQEAGIRALLNLGHTFGHAIEAEQGYGNWLHGEAVSAGIVLAAQVALEKNWLETSDFRRINTLLAAFDLPLLPPAHMGYEEFIKHMVHDKKVQAGKIRFVIPQGIGKAVVTKDIDEALLRKVTTQ